MREEAFLELVEQAGRMTPQEAREAARATLRTLAERITPGEAEDVAVFVPGEFRELVASGPDTPELFGPDELVRRVARREGVDGRTAVRHVHAVFAALGKVASGDALSNLGAQLSADFDPLLEVAWRRGGSGMPQARAGGIRADERCGEALGRPPVGWVSASSALRPGPARIQGAPAYGQRKGGPQEAVMTTRSTTSLSRRVFGAYRAVDRAFQRLFDVDARLLYGFVVPVLAISGLVVLLALDPSSWLLALAVLLLLAASLIVVLGILRMLSEDDGAG